MTDNLKIANTILDQIKTQDFWALGAWAAREFIAVENGVRFKVSGAKFKGFVFIRLNGSDLYDLEFGKVRKLAYSVKEEVFGIYFDQLIDCLDQVIEKEGIAA